MNKSKEYEILTVLDFTKVPNTRLDTCLNEFELWVKMMKRVHKVSNILTPIDKFIWVDDKKQNITIKLINNPLPDKKKEK